MTVKELKEKLSKHADNTKVVVYWEGGNDQHFYEIDDISLSQGNAVRDTKGNAGFAFDRKGPDTWVFISVDPA